MVKISAKARILVVGIGNILLRDEGIGVHVVKAMEKIKMPPAVELLDGGTAGADLLDAISDRQKVIVVDACDADVPPGTILRLTPEDLSQDKKESISLHEFGIVQTLDMAGRLNCAPREVAIIAVKPKTVEPGLEMSAEMTRLIPRIIEAVLNEIRI